MFTIKKGNEKEKTFPIEKIGEHVSETFAELLTSEVRDFKMGFVHSFKRSDGFSLTITYTP